MTAIKLEPRLRKDVVQALHAHAPEMFADQAGQWTAGTLLEGAFK